MSKPRLFPLLIAVVLGFAVPVLCGAQRPLGPPFQVNAAAAGLEGAGAAALAMNARGDFVVAWVSVPVNGSGESRTLHARRFAADGTPRTGDILVSSDLLDRPGPEIALMEDGSFFVVLPSYPDLVARRYGPDGSFEGESVVARRLLRGSFEVAALPEGGFALAWMRQTGDQLALIAKIIGADGQPAGPERRVAKGDSPAIAAQPDGGFVVAWIGEQLTPEDAHFDDRYVLAQRFGADGRPLGGRIAVQERFHGIVANLRAAADGAGNFLLLWQQAGQLRPVGGRRESQEGLYARRFSQEGSPLTGVVELEGFRAEQPQLAIDRAGNFVVTFSSPATAVSGTFAQRFTADGAPFRPAFLVVPRTGGALVASDAGGNFVVVWSASPQVILAERYRKR
jgi:hypothetical protein